MFNREGKGPNRQTVDVAFALGGLGGNNAHGAGLLQAALDTDTHPQLLSFTSGQIYWVYNYLKALQAKQPDALRKQLEMDIAATQPFPQLDLDVMMLGMFGKGGAIRPARHEFLVDFIKNSMTVFEHVIEQPTRAFFIRELMSTLPARQMVMLFDDEFFHKINDAFNACSDIGLMFNSFDPREGIEIVHLNDCAKSILHLQAGQQSSYRSRTLYKDIKHNYVRDGLWIYQYGFEDNNMLDGAFYRQIMLSELAPAKTIFVARPINYKWLGKMPASWMEVEDMKLEISFNGSYQGERDKVLLVNKLIHDGVITDPRYIKIDLCEIEIETQESFFDYIFEDMRVFDQARVNAAEVFRRHQPAPHAADAVAVEA